MNELAISKVDEINQQYAIAEENWKSWLAYRQTALEALHRCAQLLNEQRQIVGGTDEDWHRWLLRNFEGIPDRANTIMKYRWPEIESMDERKALRVIGHMFEDKRQRRRPRRLTGGAPADDGDGDQADSLIGQNGEANPVAVSSAGSTSPPVSAKPEEVKREEAKPEPEPWRKTIPVTKKFMNSIESMKGAITGIGRWKEFYLATEINFPELVRYLDGLFDSMKVNTPYAACPFEHPERRKCPACLDKGWLTAAEWEAVPSELKEKK